MSRRAGRIAVLARALPLAPVAALARALGLRRRPNRVRRLLVVHDLLLGDTLMLTALIAALRHRYVDAEIYLTLRPPLLALYQHRPYGVIPLVFDPRQPTTIKALLDQPGFDLAVVPGDNRYTWLALAAKSRWIVAHSHDRPAWKNWPLDEGVDFPDQASAWPDMVAALAATSPPSYHSSDWPPPDPPPTALALPKPYVLLHLGASTSLKHWPSERWHALAEWLDQRGQHPVWSTGPGEHALIRSVDPDDRWPAVAGDRDLAGVWHLIANARALVCPDTGVAHLARLTATPSVVLFGPGSPTICGGGQFWPQSLSTPVYDESIPCRDQPILFRRRRDWIRRCGRSQSECVHNDGNYTACMSAISLDRVTTALTPWL